MGILARLDVDGAMGRPESLEGVGDRGEVGGALGCGPVGAHAQTWALVSMAATIFAIASSSGTPFSCEPSR